MKEFKVGTKYNDIIMTDDIHRWAKNKENVIFDGSTGSGKTYFMEHKLYEYVKQHKGSILYLCNRKSLYKQELEYIKQSKLKKYIDIRTYQDIEDKLIKGEKISSNYTFIVADECHYIYSDSMFNMTTDITDSFLCNVSTPVIFMSGTCKPLFNRLLKKGLVKDDNIYKIPYDYSYATLKYYNKVSESYDILNHLLENTEDKIIYFSNNLNNAIEYYNNFVHMYGRENIRFICSKFTTNKDARRINDGYENIMVSNGETYQSFDGRLLIATKALDNGVSFIDRKIKHIVSDIADLDSLQQSLGRKRIIDKDDTCTFYVCNYKKAMQGFLNKVNKEIEIIRMFKKDREQFNKLYIDQRKQIRTSYIYDCCVDNETMSYTKKVNNIGFSKLLIDKMNYEEALRIGYVKQIMKRLGNTMNYEVLEDVNKAIKKDELELYLETLIGKELDKEKQTELVNKIELKDKYGRKQVRLNVINPYLVENYDMSITSKQVKRRGIKKQIWVLTKNI